MKFIVQVLALAGIILLQMFLPVQVAGTQVAGTQDKVTTPAGTREEKEVRKSSDISTFNLANGLQVVVIPDHRAPIVTHMIWYKVGAADDPVGKSGIAHYLEHLMFKGTKNTLSGVFSKEIAKIGGKENAFTNTDYTAYHQTISPDNLKMVMALEADRMENLALSNAVMEPERNVVLEERLTRVNNRPESILNEVLLSTLFSHHPYGIPIIGHENEIRGLTLQDVTDFYDKYYTPNNAILVVAGDVDEKTVRKLAEETYGKVPRQAEPDLRHRIKEPQPVAARMVFYRDERVTYPKLIRLYLTPSYQSAGPGEAEALDILADILGGSSSSRIYRELVFNQEMATRAGVRFFPLMDMGEFAINVSPRGETTLEQLEVEIDRIVEDIIDNGVKQKEVNHARKMMIKSTIYARDNREKMANIVGSVLSTGGSLADVLEWTENLKSVTVADVNAVARKFLGKQRSVTGYLLPEKIR